MALEAPLLCASVMLSPSCYARNFTRSMKRTSNLTVPFKEMIMFFKYVMCVYVHTYVYMCLYICMHVHIEAGGQRFMSFLRILSILVLKAGLFLLALALLIWRQWTPGMCLTVLEIQVCPTTPGLKTKQNKTKGMIFLFELMSPLTEVVPQSFGGLYKNKISFSIIKE